MHFFPSYLGILFLGQLPRNEATESKDMSILIDLAKMLSKSYIPFTI